MKKSRLYGRAVSKYLAICPLFGHGSLHKRSIRIISSIILRLTYGYGFENKCEAKLTRSTAIYGKLRLSLR
jgi:hypothetical protein